MSNPDFDSEYNRRSFLRGGSFATLMMMLGGVEIQGQEAKKPEAYKEKKPGPPVHCGVIGLGRWGRDMVAHLERLPNAPVTAVCDTYGASLRRGQRAAANATAYEDYRKLLDDKNVHAVIVATGTHEHKEIVLAALQAGKHVYCEAPLAHSLEDARAIAKAGKAAKGLVFQGGLQFRGNPQHHHVHEFIATGAAGKVTTIRGQHHIKQSWRQASPNREREVALNWRLDPKFSPGLVGEVGVHQIDAAGWYLMSRPKSVTGFGGINHWSDGRKVADTVQVVVEFENGVNYSYEATLTNSYDGTFDVYSGTDAAVMVRGNKAWMFKEADSPLLGWEVYARKDDFFDSGETGIALVANATQLLAQGLKPAEGASDADNPVYYSLEHFVECINEKKEPHANAEVSYQATMIGLMANEAVKKGGRVEFKPEWFELG